MISREQALAIARQWASAGRPGPEPEIELYEFDLGYVAWEVMPPPPPTGGPPAPPASTGFPSAVIDRATGEVSRWRSVPPDLVAEEYTQHRAAEGRFPPDVRHVLDKAGWRPGRDATAAVNHWMRRFADELTGLECSPAARAALIEFGGLQLPQFGGHGEPGGGYTSFIFPTVGGIVTDKARGFSEEFDNPVFPFGNNEDGPSELVVDAQGRVFMLHWADDFFVGPDIDTAIVKLIRGGPMTEASDLDWPK
ncbi:SUKH-3 domain-containing protein [Verrucosispora sp. TAA-831]|uniref:SUKH-3 domain-containing protein n=1 Tax=Verrucosispora sp. TAA-831 TaxID=3422227 RepID=UPI003D6E7F35